jgi:hypothetical protein
VRDGQCKNDFVDGDRVQIVVVVPTITSVGDLLWLWVLADGQALVRHIFG